MAAQPPNEPYRGIFALDRPPAVSALPLPPAEMPLFAYRRLRKRWRYVAVHSDEFQICAASISIGPMNQCFWAVWDRQNQQLHEGSSNWSQIVRPDAGRLIVADSGVEMDFSLDESAGVEVVTPYQPGWAWTRKQGGVAARGSLVLNGKTHLIEGRAIIDDSAGFPPRHVDWKWSAGIGTADDGRAVAWNFVTGIHDSPTASERTVWIDGEPFEVGVCEFADDLSTISFSEGGQLGFHSEATRSHSQNLLIARSNYKQPFGSFSGSLPHAGKLQSGLGVMEDHSVAW